MKKKLVCFMLSSMMVLSLAACGGEETAADATEETAAENEEAVSETADEVTEESNE